jgi:hypothetical protein
MIWKKLLLLWKMKGATSMQSLMYWN